MTVAVLLVDDHPMIRQGLRSLLETASGFSVVGEADDGLEALQKIERLKPDILIVDMMMPGLNGLEVLSQVRRLSPSTHSLVLSMQSAEPYVVEAFRAGASGYILKDTAPGELLKAISAVCNGDRYLSERLAERFEARGQRLEQAPLDPYETLSPREREVFQLVAEGHSSSQIGRRLVISSRTAEVHRARIMKKLGLRNRADLVRYAIQRGILPAEE